MRRRVLSLVLCLAMLATMLPVGALAASTDETQAATVTEATVETTAETTVETTVEATTEATAETTAETTPETTAEATEPDSTQETEAETVPETTAETEPEKEGFPGMPEGFTLSADQKADKEYLAKNQVAAALAKLKEGKDYLAGQILFWADSAQEAKTIADAYGAELLSYAANVGTAKLAGATVAEAVAAAADLTNTLPAVDPVYIHETQPLPEAQAQVSSIAPYAMQAPEIQVWENFKDGDPFLEDPTSPEYQWYHDMVNTYEAWGVTQGGGVTVAVLDSGVDDNHEDLEGKVTILEEYDGATFDKEPVGGHGTHVAGIIAATQGNGIGGAGVAPEAKILSINVFDVFDEMGPGASDAAIMRGINAAVANGADIINMSLGGLYCETTSSTMQKTITKAYKAGVTIFAAMGNDGTNTRNDPACLEHVIAVAAVNRSGARAEFSSYGDWADLAAPGVGIQSSIPGGYDNWSGTSMACPVAAGVAALYISALGYNPGPDQVETALKNAVTKVSDSGIGAGIVDAAKLFASDTTKPKIGIFNVDEEKLVANEEAEEGSKTLFAPFLVTLEQKSTLFASSVISDSRQSSGAKVYSNYTLAILAGDDSTNHKMLVYTTDGTNPAVQNGVVTNGTALYLDGKTKVGETEEAEAEEGETQAYIGYAFNLKSFPVNQKITVRAAFVSGMGVMGKIATLSFKITPSASDVTAVRVQGDTELVAGKSATYTAVVEPAQYASQSVTWKIVDQEDAPGAKLSTKGVLTTKATDTGTITIQAASTANSEIVGTLEVELVAPKEIVAIKTLAINASKLTMGTTPEKCGEVQLELTKLINVNNEDVLEDDDYNTKVVWSSSNTSIATVDETGKVHTWGLGKATITCTTTDGSRKSAKCVITVVTPPEELIITGQSDIGRGKSATYKITAYPTSANKNVIWSLSQLDGSKPDDVTVSTTGVVKVAKTAPHQTLLLTATSVTGWTFAEQVIRVSDPTSYVKIYPEDAEGYVATENKDSTLKTLSLYTADIPETDVDDRRFQLTAETSTDVGVVWSSSKTSVATVDETGYITAHAAGKAVITCKANDGSNKKATVTVTVTTPASYISIQSGLNTHVQTNVAGFFPDEDAEFDFRDIYTLAWAKNTTNKAVLGDTYGKPGSAKVTWSYDLVRRECVSTEDGDNYKVYTEEEGDAILKAIRKSKLVSLSSSGKLTFSNKLGKYELEAQEIYVIVKATVDYGTHTVEGHTIYQVVDPTTKLNWRHSKTVTLKADEWMDETCFLMFDSNAQHWNNFTVTSSNPKVLNVEASVVNDSVHGIGVPCRVTKTGTAKITIKANDGTGKTATITVRIK